MGQCKDNNVLNDIKQVLKYTFKKKYLLRNMVGNFKGDDLREEGLSFMV